MTRLIGLLTLLAGACAAMPAGASAATWTSMPAACYVSVGAAPEQREIVPVAAAGFTPLRPVDVLEDGQPADVDQDGQPESFTSDDNGRVSASLRVPYMSTGERPFTLTVREKANPGNAITVTTRVTALAVALSPAQARPSQRVHFHGRGFTDRKRAVWGHYLYKGKLRRTVRLAKRPFGACGRFSAHRRQIPVRKAKMGRWTLQVDQQRTYSPAPQRPFFRITITVGKRIRP